MMMLWSVSNTTTAQTVLVSPTGEGGFELGSGSFADNGWTVVTNGTVTNNWYTGSGLTNGAYSFPTTSRCAYISADGGTSWGYVASTDKSTHFYRDITIPAGENNILVSFKYAMQLATNGRFVVYVCSPSLTPVVGQPTSGSVAPGTNAWGTGSPLLLLNPIVPGAPGTNIFSGYIPQSFINACSSNQTIRLVFTSNGSTTVTAPPVALDEINVVSYPLLPSPSLGVYTVNNTLPTSGNNFASLSEAIGWVNAVSACGLTNPITFNVSAGQTFNENLPTLTASGSLTNPIVFQRSGVGANPILSPKGFSGVNNAGSYDYGICLEGADYITFDGIDVIAPNALTEFGYLLRAASSTNGSTNNTIKNMTILLDRTNTASRGIALSASVLSGGGIAATTASGTNSYNSFLNFTIGNVFHGIQLFGSSDILRDIGNIIGTTSPSIFNHIGRDNVPNDIGSSTLATESFGLYAYYQEDIKIYNSKFTNISSTGAVNGICLGSTTPFGGLTGSNNRIYNNILSNIKSYATTTASTVTGLRLYHYTVGTINIKVFNNVVYNLTSTYTGSATTTRAIKGVWLPLTTALTNAVTYEFVNNTVQIDGSGSPNLSNIVWEANSTTPSFKLFNNVFSNLTAAQSGSAMHFGVATLLTSSTLASAQGGPNKLGNVSGTAANYNNVYIANTTNGHYGAYTTTSNVLTTLSTLTSWKANFTSPALDVNSISINPSFNSSSVLIPFYASALSGAFPSLTAPYDLDITGTTRSLSNSTLGAYETLRDAIAPIMSDSSLNHIYDTLNRVVNGYISISDNSQLNTTVGFAPRMYFKRSTEANVFGANNSSTNGWKWVEASNAVSPFDFTLDYTLLTGGVANTYDTIQYFTVAQDTLLAANIASVPSAGFAGTSVANVLQAPTNPKSYIIMGTAAAFVDANVTQGKTLNVAQASVNSEIIRVAVQTAAGSPAYVSSFTFDAVGVNDKTNIARAKVWYTGTSSTFDTVNLFGTYTVPSGSGSLGNFVINGNRLIHSGTSYFWLTYELKSGAIINDSVDASLVSLTYFGAPQTPTIADPAGNRKIKSSYCVPTGLLGGYCISNVTLNTLSNTSGSTCTSPNLYFNYAPAGNNTTGLFKGSQYTLSVTPVSTGTCKVYAMFDFNDDGIFGAGDTFLIATTTVAGVPVTYKFTVPCNATATELRMRVRTYLTSSPTGSAACFGTSVQSEVEDYTLTLLENPVHVTSNAAVESNALVFAGAVNHTMMRVPVTANGCGLITTTELRANTGLSDNPSTNIVSAKLYTTGNATIFNTNKLLGTVTNPSGGFVFSILDTLSSTPGDTNNYWIVYDIAPGAPTDDTLDVAIDSLLINGTYYIPSNNNPAFYSVVKPKMTYISSSVGHINLNRVPQSNTNTQVLKINIVTSATGAPIPLTQFNLTTLGGGVDTTNIANAKVYYTGNNNTFATTLQFANSYNGKDPLLATWAPYSLNAIQQLTNGNNYFWLVYDVNATAAVGDSIDAGLTSFILDNAVLTPTTNDTTGNIVVRAPYCASIAGSANFEDILNVTVGSINNSSTTAQTGGPGSTLGRYSDYSALTPANLPKGVNIPFSVTGGSAGQLFMDQLLVFADWNQDGDFTDAGENLYTSPVMHSASNATPSVFTGGFTIPCSAVSGLTRLRFLFQGQGSTATLPCGSTNYFYGETEDYTINVVNNPISFVSAQPKQTSAYVAVNSTDRVVMRIPVKAQGCGLGTIESMYFRTVGTTNDADITSVKLYSSGNTSTFNVATATLVQTTAVVGGAFSFTGLSAGLLSLPTDTNNYWITYDVSPSALIGNTLDAVLDSVYAMGMQNISANPAGSLLVSAKMTYVSSTAAHIYTSAVNKGGATKLLKIAIVTSSAGAPADLTTLNLSTNGGMNDDVNIDSIKVFYTGHSATYDNTTPFGTRYIGLGSSWGTFAVNGNQTLLNDTNYFWVMYYVKSTANTGDSLDAELVDIALDGNVYAPVVSAPIGKIAIKPNYCTAITVTNFNYSISNVQVGSFSNTSACGSYYTDYTSSLEGPVVQKEVSASLSLTHKYCPAFGFGNVGGAAIYIDLNQDGDFSDAGENVWTSISGNFVGGTYTGDFTIPCAALVGQTRMRVVYAQNGSVAPCNVAISGEVEDYTITILDNPQTYTLSTAYQTSGTVGPNSDVQMMRVKVKATKCGNGEVTAMYFNTAATTNPADDIAEARLYATGASTVFSTTTQVGSTVMNPTGEFSFSFNNTLLTNNADSNNYWLVYRTTGNPTTGNVIDVRVDSITVLGVNYIPTNNDPVQVKTIDNPMLVLSSTVSNIVEGGSVARGSNDFALLKVMVVTSSTGSPIALTQFDLNANGGGQDSLNMSTAKMYYTGNSSVFNTTFPFGTATPATGALSVKWPAYTITGSQALANDTNYFWLAVDVKATAMLADSIDAELISMTIGGVPVTPTVTAPAGNITIRNEYCVPGLVSGLCINNVTIGTLNNTTGACTVPYYTLFAPAITTNIYRGNTMPITVSAASASKMVLFIDYNKNGLFSDAGEQIDIAPNPVTSVTYNIAIPNTALLGETRMRVRTYGVPSSAPVHLSCDPYNYSETEDYVVQIVPGVTGETYVWNQTTPANFNTASNWTPSRFASSNTDRLVFGTGFPSTVTVNNILPGTIGTIEVLDSTRLIMNAVSATILETADSIIIGNNSIIQTDANVILQAGINSLETGNVVLGATALGIDGNLRRWVGPSAGDVTFPLCDADGTNRMFRVNYTTLPTVYGTITGKFVKPLAPGASGLPVNDSIASIDVNKISPVGSWTITADNGLTGGTYTGTFEVDSFPGVFNVPALVLMNRVDGFSPWVLNGVYSTTNGTVTNAQVIRTGMSGFNQFAIGSDVVTNPLPVSLINFTAKVSGKDANLAWSTASEKNNRGFELERSVDGKAFTTVTFVKGAGNTAAVSNYNFTDAKAFANNNTLYYRLKQIDFDGKTNYSNTIKISSNEQAANSITVYPNPFNSEYVVAIEAANDEVAKVVMTDLQGRIVVSQSANITKGVNSIPVNAALLNAGVYFVKIESGTTTQTIKLIKQ